MNGPVGPVPPITSARLLTPRGYANPGGGAPAEPRALGPGTRLAYLPAHESRAPIAVLTALRACVALGLLLASALASADTDIRREPLELESGAAARTVIGEIRGAQGVDYTLRARAGQALDVRFEPSHSAAYFNVLPPGSDVAIFVGSISGNHFEGALPADGVYTLRVYLTRSAARRNESARYSLRVRLAAGAAFDRTLELEGIRFRVTCANEGSQNALRIVPSGLEIENAPIERTIDGTVTGAEVADLNADGSPEIYVYVTSAGSGSYGSLLAYSANRRKSLSEIYLPPVTQDERAAQGYMGHDEFAVVERTLARRFPVYREGDPNAKPTGGTRQLEYELVPGEAGWILRLERVLEY
jgi:Periplasmic lysozyme inhibitor of I-type lysozyme